MDIQVEIPEELLPFKEKFDLWRKDNRRCKCAETYERLYPIMSDPTLTFEEIGRLCGGRPKQWVSNMLANYFPGVRLVSNGRCIPASQQKKLQAPAESRLEKRRKVREAFEASCVNFPLLKKHTDAAGLRLGLVWKRGRPHHRIFRIKGRTCLVMRVCTIAKLNGPRGPYAHALAPLVTTLKNIDDIVVLVEIDQDGLKISRLYRISVKTYLKKGQTNIIIRLTKRIGKGGAKPLIRWSRYLLSKLD